MTLTRLWATGAMVLVCAVSGPAQPPAGEPNPAPDQTVREQTIYVPFSKLRKVFEQPGRGVFLPYEEFQTLWKQAREAKLPQPDLKPPVAALITDIESEAAVADEVVNVTAKLNIEVLAPGWHSVPLRLADAAILTAKLGDQPARITSDPNTGYALLLQKQGKAAEQFELTLEYVKAFTKSPGQNKVSFQAPQAPVNRWRIRIPQSGVKVNVQPLIAATQEPAAAPPAAPAKETVVLAFVGSSPTVSVDWTPKAEGAAGLEALATVQADHQVTIDEGVIRTRAQLAYKISRAELTQLSLQTPADHKVLNVFDPNVKEWKVEQQGDVNTIRVQLYEPARATQNLIVELEQFSDDLWKNQVATPVVKALGVGQQQGVVVVRVAATLRAEAVDRVGLLQLDAGELPQAFAGQPWTCSYRYATLPTTLQMLTLRLEKVQPQIRTRELLEAYLEPERLTLDWLVIYEIERAGVFQLDLDIPAQFEVRQVQGQAAADAQPVAVDAHHLTGEKKTRLIVNLARKALGKVGLLVELQRRLEDPNLLTPTNQASDISLPVPRVVPTGIERSVGRLIVYAPESLRVNPTKQEGLQVLSVADALEGTASTRNNRFGAAREILSYGYGREAVDLVLTAERRKPQITAAQLLVARIEAGVVNYETTLFYEIRYSSVKTLRLDVPTNLVGEIRNQSTAVVSEAKLDPQPDNVPDGYVAWSLTGQTELLGDLTIKFAWNKKLGDLEVGKGIDLGMPCLKPQDIDRAWGQIVLAKAETLDVQPSGKPTGLQPIDPQRLMKEVRIDDAARAFEFYKDWKLQVQVTQFQLEEVKRTSIELAVVRMEVTRSKVISVQALYRVRSARQRLAMVLPNEVAFDTEPLRINGRAIPLERGDQDEFYIPLVGQEAKQAFVLEVRYTVAGDYSRLDLPHFPEEPAVQKVYLCAYLPRELTFLGSLGPWTDETGWPWFEYLSGTAPRAPSDEELVKQVIGTLEVPNPFKDFASDGRLQTFSTLRPAPPPEGSLRLLAVQHWFFSGLVFVLVAAVGVAVVRRPLSHKLNALVALLATLVVLGVFLPTLAHQLLGGALLSAVLVVLATWTGLYLLTAWRQLATVLTWPRNPTPAPPVVTSPVMNPPADSGGTSPFVPQEQPVPAEIATPQTTQTTEQGGQSHG